MNNIGAQFDRMQVELDSQYRNAISQLNELCENVALLNKTIKSISITGEAPNDHMDARNLLLDQISSMIDCEIYERDDGMYDVICNGTYLVYRDSAKRLLTMQTPETGMFHKAFVVMREDNPPVLEELRFGQCMLKGLLESRGDYVKLPDVSANGGYYNAADPLGTLYTSNVLFERGSISNGSPNTKADIVIAVDLSSAGAEYLEQLKLNIDNYVDGLFKKGLDFNLKLVTTDSNGASPPAVVTTLREYGRDEVNEFIADVLSLESGANAAGATFESLLDVLGSAAINYRESANRYTVFFTAEGINGDTLAPVTQAQAAAYAEKLHGLGMSLSVVTSERLHNEGDGAPTAPFGWGMLTSLTGGASISFDEIVGNERVMRDFAAVMQDANDFINRSVNDRISMIQGSEQILPEVRRRVNALINIICRSINELHRSGKTLEVPPRDGEDFFVPINANRPLELGNVMINPKFLEPSGLNYIVASESGSTEDNLVARAIANLRNQPRAISTAVGETTFDDYYRDAIYLISNQAAESERYLANQITVADSLNQMRHAIMDVSMDEELSQMMKFKFGYDAAARVLNVIDNMIEHIVTRLGHVGR